VAQSGSVKPGRQTHDVDVVLSETSTTQLAPFLQRFRSVSEQGAVRIIIITIIILIIIIVGIIITIP